MISTQIQEIYNKMTGRQAKILSLGKEVRYDPNPCDIEGKVKINIGTEGEILCFTYSDEGIARTYRIDPEECTMSTWRPTVVQADLILVPLLRLVNLDIDSAIVYYRSGEEFHLRTAAGQMSKIYFFKKGNFSPFASPRDNKSYSIEITDHKYWSTSN
jgi:hypothetical protein